jgi:hypothetical protein
MAMVGGAESACLRAKGQISRPISPDPPPWKHEPFPKPRHQRHISVNGRKSAGSRRSPRLATAILVEIDEQWIASDRTYLTMNDRDE